jgi:hypothetical protein
MLRSRQELTTNSRAHLDLWKLLMIDDWHRHSFYTLRKTGSAEIRHGMSRKATHQAEHRLMGHQSPRIKPTNQFTKVELLLEAANALDAVLWRTDDGHVLTNLFDGQELQACLHLLVPFLRGCVQICVAGHHTPAEDVEVVHDALARQRHHRETIEHWIT